jgi:hypothetical protein
MLEGMNQRVRCSDCQSFSAKKGSWCAIAQKHGTPNHVRKCMHFQQMQEPPASKDLGQGPGISVPLWWLKKNAGVERLRVEQDRVEIAFDADSPWLYRALTLALNERGTDAV